MASRAKFLNPNIKSKQINEQNYKSSHQIDLLLNNKYKNLEPMQNLFDIISKKTNQKFRLKNF